MRRLLAQSCCTKFETKFCEYATLFAGVVELVKKKKKKKIFSGIFIVVELIDYNLICEVFHFNFVKYSFNCSINPSKMNGKMYKLK